MDVNLFYFPQLHAAADYLRAHPGKERGLTDTLWQQWMVDRQTDDFAAGKLRFILDLSILGCIDCGWVFT